MYWNVIGTGLWLVVAAYIAIALYTAIRHAYEADREKSQDAVYGLPMDASLPADRPRWADPAIGLGAS